jgi:hypothetical protein
MSCEVVSTDDASERVSRLATSVGSASCGKRNVGDSGLERRTRSVNVDV